MEINVNENKAQALNELHSYINQLIPKLEKYFEEAEVKFKNDRSLYTKNKKETTELIKENQPGKVRCFLDHSEYSGFSLRFDTNYSVTESSVAYLHNYYYFGSNSSTFFKTDYTADFFVNGEEQIKKLEDESREIQSKLSELKASLFL